MIQVDNKWVAQDGYFFVRKSDGKIMGSVLFLGEEDSIENYMERPYSQEEKEEFDKQYSYGSEDSDEAPSGSGTDD